MKIILIFLPSSLPCNHPGPAELCRLPSSSLTYPAPPSEKLTMLINEAECCVFYHLLVLMYVLPG